MSLESVLHKSFLAPTIITSYSAWLLDVLQLKRRDCSMRILSGPSSTTPAPVRCGFEEPSTCIVHQVSWVGGCS